MMKKIIYSAIISLFLSPAQCYSMEYHILNEERKDFIFTIAVACGALSIGYYCTTPIYNKFLQLYKILFNKPSAEKPKITTSEKKFEFKSDYKDKKSIPHIADLTPAGMKKALKDQKKIKEPALHKACQNNDAEQVKQLLQDPHTDVNEVYERNTAFHLVCENGNKEILDILLAAPNLKIKISNQNSYNPLQVACIKGNLEIVKAIFSRNAFADDHAAYIMNWPFYTDATCVCLAYKNQYLDIVDYLLDQKYSDIDKLLQLICEKNDTEIMECYLKSKNIKFCRTLLNVACRKGLPHIVRLVLNYNEYNWLDINNNTDHELPLFIACGAIKLSAHREIIDLLLNHQHINVNAKSGGCTILHIAANDLVLLQRLLHIKNIALNEVITREDSQKTITFMQENPHWHAYQLNFRGTPLHRACALANEECIKLLINSGADITIKDYENYTPFSLLCLKAAYDYPTNVHRKLLEKLLLLPFFSAGIINSSNALYESVLNYKHYKDNYVAELLLRYGADPTYQTEYDGSCPVLKAATCNWPLCSTFFTNCKINYKQRDAQNQTILYKAFMAKHIDHPNQLDFFTQLSSKRKTKFLQQELYTVAHFTPSNIATHDDFNIPNAPQTIKRFHLFIHMCAEYGKIDLTNTIFFDIALQKAKQRSIRYIQSEPPPQQGSFLAGCLKRYSRYRCMHSDKKICYRYNSSLPTIGCYDCVHFFPRNELIIHAFARHIIPKTIEQTVEHTIAKMYEENPVKYYDKKQEKKELIKAIITKEVTRTPMNEALAKD